MTGAHSDTSAAAKRSREAWALIQAILKSAKRLLISVPIILVPVLLFLLLNEGSRALPDPIARSAISFDAAFLFGDRFLHHLSLVASNWALILALFLSMNALGGWITLLGFATILDAISKGRADILENARSITPAQTAKFVLSQIVLYVCYLIVATLVYLALYCLYWGFGLHSIHYGLLAFALLVPLHFALTSMYSLILRLAVDSAHELRLLRIAIRPRNVARLFAFYAARLAIEIAVGMSVYFVLRTFISDSLAIVAGGLVALLVPFAFLRVSSVIFKLTLLSEDPAAHKLILKSLPGGDLRAARANR